MAFKRNRLISRTGPGLFKVTFPPHIRAFLVQIGSELDSALDADHPALTRLFPTAYPDDAERDAGYQVFAHGALIDQRREAIRQVAETADADELTLETLSQWMRVINDTRLVLGTILDVSDGEELVVDDSNEEIVDVYELLGYLLSEIIEALQEDL